MIAASTQHERQTENHLEQPPLASINKTKTQKLTLPLSLSLSISKSFKNKKWKELLREIKTEFRKQAKKNSPLFSLSLVLSRSLLATIVSVKKEKRKTELGASDKKQS
jgi:hypothetical protein